MCGKFAKLIIPQMLRQICLTDHADDPRDRAVLLPTDGDGDEERILAARVSATSQITEGHAATAAMASFPIRMM